jgi:primosomal protein N' (replication factor Y)
VLDVLTGKRTTEDFLEEERALREALHYPPVGRVARIRIESTEQSEARTRSQSVAHALERIREKEPGLEILGPSEAFLEKAKGIYRWDILAKSLDLKALHRALLQARALARAHKWPLLVDVDPSGIG